MAERNAVGTRELSIDRDRFRLINGFGLVSQMRRAAVSIPSNIAEGQARRSTAEFVHFVSTAEGSLAELDTQLQLGIDLGFCDIGRAERASGLLVDLKKMLNALRRALVSQ